MTGSEGPEAPASRGADEDESGCSGQPPHAQPRSVARTPAPAHTCYEVLEEAILELFDLGRANGMTEDDIDAVLLKMLDDRALSNRKSFKIHGDRNST
jgi:hypothetical protein